MKKIIFATALAATFLVWSQTNAGAAMNNPLDGTWELVSGQPLPKGARDIKIISDGHFMFVAYDTGTGKPLYTAGGTFVLNGSSYIEHMDFASEQISALIGKDQQLPSRSTATPLPRPALSRTESLFQKFGSG